MESLIRSNPQLNDIEFFGFRWVGSEPHVDLWLSVPLASGEYRETIVRATWAAPFSLSLAQSPKACGPLLSIEGDLSETTGGRKRLRLHFGNDGQLDLQCQELLLRAAE